MIPISLKIKNFLPYKTPDTLVFEGIHLACLTGANGSGKSSLLDAVTWALWGKARGRREDDLVHIGEADMIIELDFEQESNHYKVLRRRTAGKRGHGTLDLFIITSDNAPQSISEGSMRATQARINHILRLDYETFIHSSFLQQGKADAFTTRPPSERKKILSDILGLERWASYEEAVKEELKQITEHIRLAELSIDEIDRELAKRPALQGELKHAESAHQEAQQTVAEAEQALKELEQAPHDLKHSRANRERLASRLREIEQDLAQNEANITSVQANLASYQAIIEQEQDILAGHATLQSARQTDHQLNEKLRQLNPLIDQQAQLNNQLTSIRVQLESHQQELLKKREQLCEQLTLNYQTELETVQAQITDLQALDHQREQLEERIAQFREQRTEQDALRKTIEAEGISLGEQIEKLEQAPAELAICPTCGQSLSVEQRETVLGELITTREEKRDIYKQARELLLTLDEQIKQANDEVRKLKTDLKGLAPLQQRFGQLQELVNTQEESRISLDQIELDIQQVTDQLDSGQYAEDVQVKIAELEAKRAELGYDDSAAADVRATIDAYLEYEQLHNRLSTAKETIPVYSGQLETLQKQATTLQTTHQEKTEELQALDGTIETLIQAVVEFQQREQTLNAQRTIERNAYQQVVTYQQELNALDRQAERREQHILNRDTAREQEARYNELRRAFSKNGVPAMIIEAAIPELEQTANDLLAKMTDGRMHLRLNTQREKVSGGQMETLEIAIADELGERSYDLYSGGEAFRINFALRIALSKMLARRAGAQLRTLFIDEGFGTQDENGRTKLVEAINAIQHEFDMILVITHIDELRDSFPVHIEVEKTTSGSRITLR